MCPKFNVCKCFSNISVACFIVYRRQAASFGVLPTCSWGTAYVIVTYPGSRSFVVVTALEQETVVRLSCQHSTTATYNLSSLQTIYFETNDAAALGCSWPASHITANKPISVISVSTNVQVMEVVIHFYVFRTSSKTGISNSLFRGPT